MLCRGEFSNSAVLDAVVSPAPLERQSLPDATG